MTRSERPEIVSKNIKTEKPLTLVEMDTQWSSLSPLAQDLLFYLFATFRSKPRGIDRIIEDLPVCLRKEQYIDGKFNYSVGLTESEIEEIEEAFNDVQATEFVNIVDGAININKIYLEFV